MLTWILERPVNMHASRRTERRNKCRAGAITTIDTRSVMPCCMSCSEDGDCDPGTGRYNGQATDGSAAKREPEMKEGWIR